MRYHRHRLSRTSSRGAALALALLFLVLLTLLGLSAMSISQQELKMAAQLMQQITAQEQAEKCLKSAESAAASLVDTQLNSANGTFTSAPGHINVAGGDGEASVNDPNYWNDPAHSLVCGTKSRYVIEYLGKQDITMPDDRYTGLSHAMHAFRITARGNSVSETSVLLQTIFLRNSI